MAENSVGNILQSTFGSSEGSLGTIVTTFLWTFIVLILVALVLAYVAYIFRYPKKKTIIDVYNDKVVKDRVGIIRQGDGTEYLKFFWTKMISFPPREPTNVFVRYGPSKFDVFPAYGNPSNIETAVANFQVIGKNFLTRLIMAKKQIPNSIKNSVRNMMSGDEPKLKPVDYDAMDVFAALLPSQTRKYQTPGAWEKYGTTISMLMVLVVAFIFFFFLADQFGSVAETLKGALATANQRLPPPP